MPQHQEKIEYIIEAPKRLELGVSEMWRYRELFYFFTWRDIKVKYKQTLLGFLWAILQPLFMMGIFVVFFSQLLKVPTDGMPPTIFYFSGLLLWNLFSNGLSSASNSLVEHAHIIKKVYFPRLVIPISSVLTALFDFSMGFLVFVGFIIYYLFDSFSFSPFGVLGFYLLALVLTLLTTFGTGTLLASWNVKYRDFRYVIPFLIQFLMFVSPVIYPISILKEWEWASYLLAINPMTGALNLARAGFMNVPPNWTLVGISFFSSILIFFVGIYVFRKTESYFADIA